MQQRVEYRYNFIIWKFNNNYHRDGDLPAVYRFSNGKIYYVDYCQHDKYHRATGPAFINYERKYKYYYYQGKEYSSLGEMLMLEACR